MGNTAAKTGKMAHEIFVILDANKSGTLDMQEILYLSEHTGLDDDLSDLVKASKEKEICLDVFKDHFVHRVHEKKINISALRSAAFQLKNHKSLLRSDVMYSRHNRAGYGDHQMGGEGMVSPRGVVELNEHKFSNTLHGKVMKETNGFHKAWQDRTLFLEGGCLRYYKVGTVRPTGEIPLKYVSDVKKDGFRFKVTTGNRKFDFKCFSEKDCDDWVNNISAELKTVRIETPPRGKFWKLEIKDARLNDLRTITYKEVLRNVTTGDILLFQTKGIGPSIIRRATHSPYDHVGLFVRKRGLLGVLESLGEPGVLVSRFRAFLEQNWLHQYTHLVVRKLKPKLTKSALIELAKFCKGVEGKKYSLTPAKLLRRESTMAFDDKDRTYFCSELVAKALKHLELLREDCPSTEYVPGSFGESHRVTLMNGYSYGPEMRIIFPSRERSKTH
ncbi:hypothetical protein AAMO2058_001379700 [Amorphochlora amoebiformis]